MRVKPGKQLTGQIIGNWLVIEEIPKNLRNHPRIRQWKCKCLKCTNIYPVIHTYLVNGTTTQCKPCRYKEISATKDLTNQTFGNWLVIQKCEKKIKHNKETRGDYWICKCNLCDREFLVRHAYLINGRSKKCRYCANNTDKSKIKEATEVIDESSIKTEKDVKNIKILKGKHHFNWRGYEDIPATYYTRLVSAATKRGICVEISMKDIWDQFVSQDKKCALSGDILSFNIDDQTASVDRIDSNKGYTRDNIQIVHKTINSLKWTMAHEEFISFCKKVVDYQCLKNQKIN